MKTVYFTKDGTKLSLDDLSDAHRYYEAACTGDYIQETHPELDLSEDEALKLGYEVRWQMDKYDLGGYEEMAIDEVLKKHKK